MAPEALEPSSTTKTLVESLRSALVVPFLGAGASVQSRDEVWQSGAPVMPSGSELANYLASYFMYDGAEQSNLQEVAGWVEAIRGRAELHAILRETFAREQAPTATHRLLARFPGLVRATGAQPTFLLILTTNYDDALERAFAAEDEPVDVLWYVPPGREREYRFVHRPHGEQPRPIYEAWRYPHVSLAERTVIVKLHGSIYRPSEEYDSFVITPDDYIDYLTTDVWNMLPPALAAEIQSRGTLFLGHSLADWNLIVTLLRLGALGDKSRSWAVQLDPTKASKERWSRRGIAMIDMPLDTFAREVEETVRA